MLLPVIAGFVNAPIGGAGSTPNLAAVLAAGADGGAVNQTNLGGLTLADGKFIDLSSGAGVKFAASGAATPNPVTDVASGCFKFRDSTGTDQLVPFYSPA